MKLTRAANLLISVLQITHMEISRYIQNLPLPDDEEGIGEMHVVLATASQLLNEFARGVRMVWVEQAGEGHVVPADWRKALDPRELDMLHKTEVWIKVLRETYPLEN